MARIKRRAIYFIIIFSLLSLTYAQDMFKLPPSTLKIDQVFVNLPYIDIYFWMTDDFGAPREKLDSTKLKVNVGENLTFAQSDLKLSRFDVANEGIAYSILMDISLSVKGEALKSLKAAAYNLIEKMRSKDKAMIILFGSDVKVLVHFTGNRALLKEKIDSVSATDKNTVLYKSIDTAFKQNNTYVSSIPKRKAIIVISDGIDEGSGITINELKEKVMFPVYSIGFSKGKEEFVDNLVRISNISGGQYFHLTKIEDAKGAYSKITEFIKNQWHLKIKACNLKADEIERKLELLYTGRIVLNSKRIIRMLSNFDEEALKKECPPPVTTSFWEKIPLWGWILAAAVILLIIIFAVIMLKKRKREEEARLAEKKAKLEKEKEKEDYEMKEPGDELAPDSSSPAAPGTGESPKDETRAEPTVPEQEITGKASFSLVDGPLKGEKKVIPFLENYIKIGRGGLSNFIIDDSEISSEHAFIIQEKGYHYVQDNNSTNGTYVNGVKIKTVRRIQKGDIITVGSSKLRFNGEVGGGY